MTWSKIFSPQNPETITWAFNVPTVLQNVTTLPSSENMCRLAQLERSRSQHGYKGTANKTKARVASHGIFSELCIAHTNTLHQKETAI